MCNWTLEVRDILKNIVEKRRNCSLGAISPLFHNIFYMLLDFHVKAGTRFSLRDKRLFEISEVEITRVNCILMFAPADFYYIVYRIFIVGSGSKQQAAFVLIYGMCYLLYVYIKVLK